MHNIIPIYIHMARYPISYIQYGNIPMRDSPHPTPPHPMPAWGGDGWGVVWWGESLMGIFPCWI